MQHGNCVLNNLSVIGNLFNISVTDYNVTGNITINGQLCDGTHCFTLTQLNSTPDLSAYIVNDTPVRFSMINSTGELHVMGISYFDGDLIPITTLAHDIGSGTNRWSGLYVEDISADSISATENIETLSNVSADYFIGSGAYLDDLNVTGTAVFNTSTITENLTIIDITDTYNVIISGTTIYSNTYYAPLLQLGGDSIAEGDYSIAMGLGAEADSTSSVAIGGAAHSNGAEGIAIGGSSSAGYRAIGLGYWSWATGDYSTASGYATTSSGEGSTAIGTQSTASGKYSLAMGSYSKAKGNNSVAIGQSVNASNNNSYAFGKNVTVDGGNSYGFGKNGISSTDNTFNLHNLNLVVDGYIKKDGNYVNSTDELQIYIESNYINDSDTDWIIDNQEYWNNTDINVKSINGSSATIGDGTNYLEVESDGDLLLKGTASYLVDADDWAFEVDGYPNYGLFFSLSVSPNPAFQFRSGANGVSETFMALNANAPQLTLYEHNTIFNLQRPRYILNTYDDKQCYFEKWNGAGARIACNDATTGEISIRPNNDVNDYIYFQTLNNVPRIDTSGDTDLNISADGGDINFEDVNIHIDNAVYANDYYGGAGSQGITDSSNYWFCTAADCSSTCQVSIEDGLITGCT